MGLAIVCVDDKWEILKSLSEQLRRHLGVKYDIEMARGAEDALAVCAELTSEGQEIALIISDQMMPGMGGDDLLIHLHQRYPKALKIMLTGQADADAVGKVVNAAALYRYIRKPWDEADLLLTVNEALRCFQQEQQLAKQNELLKTVNAKLESSLSLLIAILEATADGILVLDNTGRAVSFNQKFLSIWNLLDSGSTYGEDDFPGAILEKLLEPDALQLAALFSQIHRAKHDFLNLKNGNIIEYYLQPYPPTGEPVGGVLSVRDVTQEKHREALTRHQAFHDALTNLPNRSLFHQKLAAALQDAASSRKPLAVMFLDLDRFKQVNDTFGHSVGDQLLQSVVQRLESCLREVDVMARWGGDEFVVLVPQIRRREDVSEIAHRLVEAIRPGFMVQNARLCVTVSIGIAVYPDDGLDGHTLLQNADVALYQAKGQGRDNYQCYADPNCINSFLAPF